MSLAYFLFHGELNFFLPRRHRNKTIEHPFDWQASIKDMIESLGVPHPEIELILVNGAPVDFNYIVKPDDRVEVHPDFTIVEANGKLPLRPPLANPPRFILDQHLGRLAAYLRMMGFDTLYRNDYHDEELSEVSAREARILLTRDIGLLKRSIVTYGYYVRETRPPRQIVEVMRRYKLVENAGPFRRCLKCNGILEKVAKEDILERLPDNSVRFYDEFHRCTTCDQIYWKGSHFERMQELITKVLETE